MRLLPAAAIAAAVALAGCSAQTRLVTNERVSDTVRAKGYKGYREVLFVPPRDDRRDVVPRVVRGIESMGFKVTVLDPRQPLEGPQGTGFVIGADGWLLTCAHVVGTQRIATVTLNGQRLLADVVKADARADLALLKTRGPLPAGSGVLSFRAADKPAAMGEDVYTIGFPLSRILGNSARMTRGLLSATAGLRDNDQEVQVSAAIQPGNSGGPLLDRDGRVIGVVNRTINPGAVAQATGGALPQNINFAIKAAPVLNFVAGASNAARTALAFDGAGGLESAGRAVAKVQAGEPAPDAERKDKMVVRLAYESVLDGWWRFRVFALAAFDHETQEALFVAGHGRDQFNNSEDAVIRDTLEQFRKAIAMR